MPLLLWDRKSYAYQASKLPSTAGYTSQWLVQSALWYTSSNSQCTHCEWWFAPLVSCLVALSPTFPICLDGVSALGSHCFTVNIRHYYIIFHWWQRLEAMRNRPLFWKELLILCPGLKCSWVVEMTFCIFSRDISFVNQTTGHFWV
jgi:hypothetical protein